MCATKVYKVLCFLFVGSLVHAYIDNDYRQKSTYLNYELSRINTNRNNYPRLRHPHPHNSRFTKMDHLLTRMSETKLKATENPFKKLYAERSTTEKHVSEEYEDVEELNDDLTNTHHGAETGDDEDSEEEEDEEEDYIESEGEDWQAEEPTDPPTEKTFTEYKWKHFGTRSRVEESRKNQGITNTLPGEVHQAVAHARKVVQQGACKIPRIRLIKIQNVYPDAGKAYIPHCTLLHRCSDETGCCRTDSLTCAPKSTERIELYFYTGRPGNYKVEKLAFYNHTECHCVDKMPHGEVMSGDAAPEDNYPIRPETKNFNIIAEPLKRCQCPELFTPEVSQKNCRCDCQEGQRDCMRIKRGKEYFSLKDRLCIQRQECGYPACEFGVYIRFSGRCPRKQEALHKITTQ